MNNKRKEKLECPYCKKQIAWNSLTRHLIKIHKVNERDAFFYSLKTVNNPNQFCRLFDVPFNIIIQYIERLWKDVRPQNFYQTQFSAFYKSIVRYREFIESDFDLFFNSVLPWKLKHPSICNSKELCSITFPDNPELAEKMYKETMLVKNPYYKHDGSLSPFSKDFNGYKGKSNEEKEKLILAATQHDRPDRNWTQVPYWTKHGYSEEEVKKIVSEKQATFSLEKCIEKYGEENGRKKWLERQERWQNTLKSKPKEEIERIKTIDYYK